MSGDTPILMADGTTKRLEDVRVGDEVYGTVRHGAYRRYTRTRVLDHWDVVKQAYRVTLADGAVLVAGGDHRFLTERGWKFVTGAMGGEWRRPYLTPRNRLMGTGAFSAPPIKDGDYRKGYLCGIIRGDGHLASYEYERAGRVHGNVHQFRLAPADEEALHRADKYLSSLEVSTQHFMFQTAIANRRDMRAIRTSARAQVDLIRKIIAWPLTLSDSWIKGFLAGVFDAEGGYTGSLRIYNTDQQIIDRISDCLDRLGFAHVIECAGKKRTKPVRVVRLLGGLREHLRFFHTTDPAISRKRDIEGLAVKSNADLRVVSIEPLGAMRLFDITTGTGDFVADGVISHNCYARPTHEYLGLSAGLDFETRVLVKEDAPALLRSELSSPRWRPEVLSMSGVTDPYQPVERRLRLTRRCLEVLAEFRNPVAVVTKNHLVTRDADLLAELARHGAAAVAVSLTTLDEDLRRLMEPRTSNPRRRLDAIAKLSKAGVPVGVMTAPVIPGLNDHELPRLLSAAAEAGATFAGCVPVRLPGAVAPLFEDWLSRHFPDRKEKVLRRIRSMRDGDLNDPRFGSRMRGEGLYASHIARLFEISCRRAGIEPGRFPALSTAAFRRCGGRQPSLFD
ncbi:PA0069 family radical SAM protein [Rubrobacter xylanophilus]|uniref:PA0069 family radical SAM protein n=1 Tax=Rubrobacter xylanophilus TaxID=49319 RepID=UPI002D7FF5B9|nr:PA0069 family radical SAM protein [Rubrobacter xylanophilus]